MEHLHRRWAPRAMSEVYQVLLPNTNCFHQFHKQLHHRITSMNQRKNNLGQTFWDFSMQLWDLRSQSSVRSLDARLG
jgi:hypothetical protein